MLSQYRYPVKVTLEVLRDILLGRNRSFARDSVRLSRGIRRLAVTGAPPPDLSGCLFLVNHYSRPGFRAWWITIALGAALKAELHWAMTSAWTFPDPLRARLVTPLTERALTRIARMYGFTLMPPMPPRPEDAARRADAVRRILRLARKVRPPIGLAPEGMDSPDGGLMTPPPGAGRFVAHLAEAGYTPVPVGAYEEGDAFCLKFGRPFSLPAADDTPAAERDRAAAQRVMSAIAELLPEHLRGIYY